MVKNTILNCLKKGKVRWTDERGSVVGTGYTGIKKLQAN